MFRALVLFLSLLFAGCVGPPAGPTGQTVADGATEGPGTSLSPAAPPAPTTELGSIAGDVLDDETRPVPGARIALLGADLQSESDAQGKFTFNEVPPGEYGLQVNKLGYEQAGKLIRVTADQVTETHIVLLPVAIPEPRIEHFQQDGYIEIGLSPLAASLHRDMAGGDGTQTRDFYFNVANDALGSVAAISWDPTAPLTANNIVFRLYACAQDDCTRTNETSGRSPLLLRDDDLPTHLAGHGKTRVSTYFAIEPCYRTASPTNVGGCNQDTILQVAFQQRFKEYVDVFFVTPAPADHSPLPPA